MPANQSRGEIEVTIDGQAFTLAPEMEGLANYQSAMGVQGLGPLLALIVAHDLRAIYHGLKCLAVKGDMAKMDKLSFVGGGLLDLQAALIKVFEAMEPPSKKVDGATIQTPKT